MVLEHKTTYIYNGHILSTIIIQISNHQITNMVIFMKNNTEEYFSKTRLKKV